TPAGCSALGATAQTAGGSVWSVGWTWLEQVDGLVAAPGTLAFHTVATEDSKPLGHPCHAGLVAVEGPIHPFGDPLKGGENRLRASTADQEGSSRVAVEGCTALRRRAATLPPLLHKGEGNVAGQRGA